MSSDEPAPEPVSDGPVDPLPLDIPGPPIPGPPIPGPPIPGPPIPSPPVPSPTPAPSRARRAVASAAVARDKTIDRLVRVLVPVIRATRVPLLVVVLIAALPSVLLIALALLRPGPDDPFWIVVAVVGLVVAAWLGVRRHQLLAIAAAPEALADAFASTVTGRDVWERAAKNLTAGRVVAAARPRRSRPLRLLNGMWRGIKLTGVLQQLVDRDELAPLMPGRLRGIGFLVVACLIAGVVLSLAIFVAFLLYLLGA